MGRIETQQSAKELSEIAADLGFAIIVDGRRIEPAPKPIPLPETKPSKTPTRPFKPRGISNFYDIKQTTSFDKPDPRKPWGSTKNFRNGERIRGIGRYSKGKVIKEFRKPSSGNKEYRRQHNKLLHQP
jgi:hypothetical protein